MLEGIEVLFGQLAIGEAQHQIAIVVGLHGARRVDLHLDLAGIGAGVNDPGIFELATRRRLEDEIDAVVDVVVDDLAVIREVGLPLRAIGADEIIAAFREELLPRGKHVIGIEQVDLDDGGGAGILLAAAGHAVGEGQRDLIGTEERLVIEPKPHECHTRVGLTRVGHEAHRRGGRVAEIGGRRGITAARVRHSPWSGPCLRLVHDDGRRRSRRQANPAR